MEYQLREDTFDKQPVVSARLLQFMTEATSTDFATSHHSCSVASMYSEVIANAEFEKLMQQGRQIKSC